MNKEDAEQILEDWKKVNCPDSKYWNKLVDEAQAVLYDEDSEAPSWKADAGGR